MVVPSRPLSDIERRVVDLAKGGDPNWKIANVLERSPSTVKRHIENCLQVYGAKNRTHLVALTLIDGTIQ